MIVRVTELPTARTYLLTVARVAEPGPRLRRITLTGDGLAGLVAWPGQDLVLHLPDGQGGGVSRRYTIRHLDNVRRQLDLDVVMHGPGPGARWAAAASVGTAVEVFGPRGKVRLASARWQLFAGDESALPGIAEMVAALPTCTTVVVIVEVEDGSDEEPIMAAAQIDVRWLYRGGKLPGQSQLLDQALDAVDLPDNDRHAYVFAESRVVRQLRDHLAARGLGPAEISAKGYWNLGR
jgi:NADPH-dependent ferric siderophore reductase